MLLTYQSKEAEAQAVVAALQALGQKAAALQLDVSKTVDFDSFFTRVTQVISTIFQVERLDFLVNNAGAGLSASFAETPEE